MSQTIFTTVHRSIKTNYDRLKKYEIELTKVGQHLTGLMIGHGGVQETTEVNGEITAIQEKIVNFELTFAEILRRQTGTGSVAGSVRSHSSTSSVARRRIVLEEKAAKEAQRKYEDKASTLIHDAEIEEIEAEKAQRQAEREAERIKNDAKDRQLMVRLNKLKRTKEAERLIQKGQMAAI